MYFNWEVLGHAKRPPPSACLGAPITVQQHGIIERFETMLHYLHMAPFGGDDLGPAASKFQGLIDSLQEPPCARLGLEDLYELLMQVQTELNPYEAHFAQSVPERRPNHADGPRCGAVTVDMPSAKPVVASRVKWQNPPSFAAADYIFGPPSQAFLEPEILKKPPNEWPPARPAPPEPKC